MTSAERNTEKYAMGLDIQATKHHPLYSHLKSATENKREALKYAREHHLSKLWAARSLMQLANLTHKKVFKEASEKIYKECRRARKEKVRV